MTGLCTLAIPYNMPGREPQGYRWLTNKRLKNVKQSAISDHLLTCDCNINFDNFTILSKDSNNINLLIKESLLISRDKLILNKTVKSFPLETIMVLRNNKVVSMRKNT